MGKNFISSVLVLCVLNLSILPGLQADQTVSLVDVKVAAEKLVQEEGLVVLNAEHQETSVEQLMLNGAKNFTVVSSLDGTGKLAVEFDLQVIGEESISYRLFLYDATSNPSLNRSQALERISLKITPQDNIESLKLKFERAFRLFTEKANPAFALAPQKSTTLISRVYETLFPSAHAVSGKSITSFLRKVFGTIALVSVSGVAAMFIHGIVVNNSNKPRGISAPGCALVGVCTLVVAPVSAAIYLLAVGVDWLMDNP